MTRMTGMSETSGTGGEVGITLRSTVLAALVMAVAMMGPAALAGVRHVADNSLVWRRGRAVALFATAYLGAWTAYGFVIMALERGLHLTAGWLVSAIALAAAGAWQLTTAKQRALRDCHRTVVLLPFGFRANVADVKFGARNALACVRSCWPLMLIADLIPTGHLVVMAAISAFVTAERAVDRPRRCSRTAGWVLLIAAASASTVILMTNLTQ